MNILEVEGLCKTYPAFRLRDVSFAVEPGAIMGFIGQEHDHQGHAQSRASGRRPRDDVRPGFL